MGKPQWSSGRLHHTFAEDVDIQLGDLRHLRPRARGFRFQDLQRVRVACDQVQPVLRLFDQRVAGQRSVDRADYGVGFGVFWRRLFKVLGRENRYGKTVMVCPACCRDADKDFGAGRDRGFVDLGTAADLTFRGEHA